MCGLGGLGQPPYLKILSEHQEGVEILLSNVDLAMVDEVDKGLKVSEPDASEIDERMMMRQPPEDVSEECRAG